MLALGCENSPHDTNFTVSALAAAPPMRTTAIRTIAALSRLDFENISTHTLYAASASTDVATQQRLPRGKGPRPRCNNPDVRNGREDYDLSLLRAPHAPSAGPRLRLSKVRLSASLSKAKTIPPV